MKVEFNTDRFEQAHGRRPKGRGGWMFHPDPNVDCLSKEIKCVNATYGEAKKVAAAHFKALGVPEVYVLT